eukprot:5917609-Pyramimonas_sp.AAC.1
MTPAGMHDPQRANTTIPILWVRDERFGFKAAENKIYSARCDTCPPGAPLLVWKTGAPPLGCFIWKPKEGV